MSSVLQPWLEKIPIRMQSTLILGLRGPDTHVAPNVKSIGRWLRSLAFKPGNPDNFDQFMAFELPLRIVEEGETAKELEFCSQHYYSHLMHALQVVGMKHPDSVIAGHASVLYCDMCYLMHLPCETRQAFEIRLCQRDWTDVCGVEQPDDAQYVLQNMPSGETVK